MPNDQRKFLRQQRALHAKPEPPGSVQCSTDLLGQAYKQLEIGSATKAFLQQQDERRKMLSSLLSVGSAVKATQSLELHRKLLEGPIEEAKRLGLFDSKSNIKKLVGDTIDAQRVYDHLFRLPTTLELGRIAREAMKQTNQLASTVLGTEEQLHAAMAAMRSPWLRVSDNLVSAKAFANIVAIGRGVSTTHTLDREFADALRSGLGDWRDELTLAPESLVSPLARSGLYVERGFDPNLTNFTPTSFRESLLVAGLCEPKTSEGINAQEDGFARANEAFDRLRRFEIALRCFINRVMRDAFGDDWMKQQLPAGMLDTWIDKRDKAMRAGCAEQSMIDYADFADYKMIIERKDNWCIVFKRVFGRKEDVRESFQRLFPVRIATMHACLITRDDELLLLVETKRVLKAIGAK